MELAGSILTIDKNNKEYLQSLNTCTRLSLMELDQFTHVD